MSIIALIFLGFIALRLIGGGGHHHRRWERASLLEAKIAKLEAAMTDLQEQAEQDRAQLARLEEEREFFRQLYPAKVEASPPA